MMRKAHIFSGMGISLLSPNPQCLSERGGDGSIETGVDDSFKELGTQIRRKAAEHV